LFIVRWFARPRESRAAAGGARLAGRNNMIGALEALMRSQPAALPDRMAAFGIAGGMGQGFRKLFMSHPPLEVRIAALRAAPLA
jgi:heat shock protein HtpX